MVEITPGSGVFPKSVELNCKLVPKMTEFPPSLLEFAPIWSNPKKHRSMSPNFVRLDTGVRASFSRVRPILANVACHRGHWAKFDRCRTKFPTIGQVWITFHRCWMDIERIWPGVSEMRPEFDRCRRCVGRYRPHLSIKQPKRWKDMKPGALVDKGSAMLRNGR